ncbi:MAG TPA: hypothetical protein VN081_03795 [Dongiaceae bacterium]|nr:hypothetical protein [Dongiaceae bacterium]
MRLDNDKKAFIRAYIEAALWSSISTAPGSDEDSDYIELDQWHGELSLQARKRLHNAVHRFYSQAALSIDTLIDKYGKTLDSIAHDLWFTQNGHGVGFWENYRWPKAYCNTLTQQAEACGQIDLYIGDDERIYAG